ncbi:MAG: hypothetical protein ABSA93_12655 [Streptosporangiaceae bacterium]|jgi:hypothetical protein
MPVIERAQLAERLRRARQVPSRPPRGLTWLASFVAIGAVLVAHNAYLFTTRIYEDSDFGADTIAVLQAKHFQLLTGNYSRLGFYHPGPAFLYIEAWGEWLFHDVTHVVPTPWNGQLLAILLLNAALLATVISVFARYGGTAVAVAGLGTVLAFTVLHPLTVNSNWMPYVYFCPALLLLVSAAAVAAGRTTLVPLLCLAAGLCIHGQAEFLFFAPIVTVTALAGLLAPHWRDPWVAFREDRRSWLAGLAIVVVFALPIVINTIINWPGELPKYFSYGTRAGQTLHHTVAVAVDYTLQFWWPGEPARGEHPPEVVVAAVGGFLVTVLACWLAMRCRDQEQRRFLLWSLAMGALMTVLFLYYAWRGIDEIYTAYEGYFYWSVPLLVLLVGAAGAVEQIQRVGARVVIPVLAAMTVAAAVAAGVVPLRSEPYGPGQYFGDPAIPHDVAVLAAASRGRPIVLDVSSLGWGDAVGVIVYADRIGVRACVSEPSWTIMFRAQSICTPAELRDGTVFEFIGKSEQPRPPGRPLFVMLASLVFPVAR